MRQIETTYFKKIYSEIRSSIDVEVAASSS